MKQNQKTKTHSTTPPQPKCISKYSTLLKNILRPKCKPESWIKAFTLIELLIVIAILSILASLVFPRLKDRKEEAKRMKAIIQIQLFMQALEKYRLDNGTYPSTQEGLEALLKKQNYLENKNIPQDPWNKKYLYLSPGNDHRLYEIICYGRDQENGGTGWDRDIKSHELEETI